MATFDDPNVAQNQGQVGQVSTQTIQQPVHLRNYPVPHGVLGHYRTSSRFPLTFGQIAATRVWEVRNSHVSNLIVVTRLQVRTVQSGPGTPQSDSLDVFRATAFSVLDTTNAVTPLAIAKRSGFAAGPGAAQVRALATGGSSFGIFGAPVFTLDASPFSSIPINPAAAAASAVNLFDVIDDTFGTHPFVLGADEGIIINNRVTNVTSFGMDAYVDFCWAEITLF